MVESDNARKRSPRQPLIDKECNIDSDEVDRGVTKKCKSRGSRVRSASSPCAKDRRASCDVEFQSSDEEEFSTPNSELIAKKKKRQTFGSPTLASPVHGSISPGKRNSPKEQPPNKFPVRQRTFKDGQRYHAVWTLVGIASTILAILFLIAICYKYSDGQNATGDGKARTLLDIADDIGRDLDVLRMKTTQGKLFWRAVYSDLMTITEDSPRQPVVFLLAVPEDSQATATCLAHELADIVTKAFNEKNHAVFHDTQQHLDLEWSDHRLELDQRLLQLKDSPAAVIHNLELMPANTAELLHGYCDNDNAPIKRAAIILLLELPVHHSSLSPQHVELAVERRLHQLWSPYLHADHIPGLVSRVASATLLVAPETAATLGDLCRV